jgi:D-sedoheptulose 7-phosphate isomerase
VVAPGIILERSELQAFESLEQSLMSILESYFDRLTQTIQACDKPRWDEAVDLIDAAWLADRQIIVLGNGGSALAAQHAITDWNKNLFLASGQRFRGVSLADNMGIFSAYSNDVSYEDVFLQQLKPIVEAGDVLVAISGSGNSENVVRAVTHAKEKDAKVICVTGYDGGKIRSMADCSVHVPIDDMQVAEDLHLVFIHVTLRELMNRGTERNQGS